MPSGGSLESVKTIAHTECYYENIKFYNFKSLFQKNIRRTLLRGLLLDREDRNCTGRGLSNWLDTLLFALAAEQETIYGRSRLPST